MWKRYLYLTCISILSDSFSAFAYTLDTITLSCTGEKNISLLSAYYAQYKDPCSDECCTLHPDDCSELMEDNAPVDWAALQLACNNQSSCTYTNPGSTVPSCADPYYSDYAIVYYSCLPGLFASKYKG